MINLANRTVLEQFVFDNIVDYNNKPANFSAKNLKKEIAEQLHVDEEAVVTESEIGIYLAEKLRLFLLEAENREVLDELLEGLEGNKSSIEEGIMEIANAHVWAFKDLKQYYEMRILNNIQMTYVNEEEYRDSIFQRILAYNDYSEVSNSDAQINYIKNGLKKAVEKSLYLALANGFSKKAVNIDTGTKIANEGDSAQFLFLARAILAGYTCSNVDVRSSRYDAVIDYEGHLLRVQVKGISNATISLKDRDRGGSGIDTTARRNRGRFISSADADIYVAVDKQFGICYIIPTTVIDAWTSIGTKSVAVSQLNEYKENWEKISEVAHLLFP